MLDALVDLDEFKNVTLDQADAIVNNVFVVTAARVKTLINDTLVGDVGTTIEALVANASEGVLAHLDDFAANVGALAALASAAQTDADDISADLATLDASATAINTNISTLADNCTTLATTAPGLTAGQRSMLQAICDSYPTSDSIGLATDYSALPDFSSSLSSLAALDAENLTKQVELGRSEIQSIPAEVLAMTTSVTTDIFTSIDDFEEEILNATREARTDFDDAFYDEVDIYQVRSDVNVGGGGGGGEIVLCLICVLKFFASGLAHRHQRL